jgi:DNA-binding response OmpR family regulator
MTQDARSPLRDGVLAARPAHDRPRILLAEDDADMRQLIVEALRRDGYDVVTASDGGRLLVALARQFAEDRVEPRVDLILSDVRMPVCTGMQILEQLRAADCKMPVILMTAFGDGTTRQRAHALGALLFEKPLELDELRTAVSIVLRSRS